jgi:uncharacterized protein
LNRAAIEIPASPLRQFCRKWHIRTLSLFGSVLQNDFTEQSDVDVLVEFEPGCGVGMMTLAGIEFALSEMLGRRVDLNTPGSLSRYFRDEVLREAETVYVAA